MSRNDFRRNEIVEAVKLTKKKLKTKKAEVEKKSNLCSNKGTLIDHDLNGKPL